ncbi:vWA domain-containing protein [Thiocapsa marina]|uniref:von Willebrand factor type A n=1 Tax=Thiocapsa marina 5811 TaxID=768671 RepID=F9U956_9GAMM|nr:vWA domain-containing protein [Thiocapsa marina]EGV19314.1 von Willebrand factor type A [Thiocapsa marina 5811]
MKTKLIALALFAATAGTVALYPTDRGAIAVDIPPDDPTQVPLRPLDLLTNERPLVEVVFVLDTTGSMGGLIQTAKDKIWSIASTMASAQPAPEIRIGLVAYRDRGDDYVTQVVDLSRDIDAIQASLMDFEAAGGGDGPESVNQALHEAIHRISWSRDPDAYKVVFLVGDAPPHLDYQDDVQYAQSIAVAQHKGIAVNAIQCGEDAGTATHWQRIAQLGGGTYFRVDQAGGAVAIATPFDRKLAELSATLDETRLYYGTAEEKEAQARKEAATDKLHTGSSVASRARRAAFNATDAGKSNLLGDKDLVEDVASGRVDLSTIAPAALPEPLQTLAPEAQQALIAETAERRKALSEEIDSLAVQRDAYLKEQVAARGGAKDSLDHRLYDAIREQAGAKGLRYDGDGPAY